MAVGRKALDAAFRNHLERFPGFGTFENEPRSALENGAT